MNAAPAGLHCCGSCPLPAICDGPEAGLPGALLDSVMEQRQLEAGATLYRAGQKRCSIWVISAGALKTCELDVEGREQVVGFHGKGDVLGIERIEIPAHRGFALALEPTQVCRIPVNRLVERLTTMPSLWRDVLGIAGRQIARAREVHRVLGQLQTGQRLAWFLLEAEGPRRGECGCSGERVLHLPMQRVVVTVDRHANTSAASIPLALAEAHEDGRLKPGQLVLMEAIGGGLTWGAALVRL